MAKSKKIETLTPASRASYAGFHFFQKYQECRRYFYLNYVCRLKPRYSNPALSFGTAFHAGKAVFYMTGSMPKARKECSNKIKELYPEYQNKDDYERDLVRCPILLELWIDKHGKDDLKKYNVVGVEVDIELNIPLTPSYKVTGCVDAILNPKKTNKIVIMETKTSSFSINLTEIGVYYGDQATMYSWLVSEKYKDTYNLIGVQPDIAYWNKLAKSTDNINCYRGDLVIRRNKDIEDFKLQIADLCTEISQRVHAYKTGKYNPIQLFHRTTSSCPQYGRRCDFADICRMDITPDSLGTSDLVKY